MNAVQPETFASLLQRHRLAANLSQAALAERADLSLRGLSDLERGVRRAPHPATVGRLAEALGLSSAERAELAAARGGQAIELHVDDLDALATSQMPSLPPELTSFVGRERELTAVARLLDESRLVTLAGPGGAGKTRLALRLARNLTDRHASINAEGMWFVELAPLVDPSLVPAAVAAALDIAPQQTIPLQQALATALRGRRALLILDNCEHVLEMCAELCALFMRACPDLRLLVISREPLRVTGEVVFRVPPLRLAAQGNLDVLAESEAVQLFVQRARAVKPDFALSTNNVAAVEHVCRRLDGLPLALELAAARVASLAPADIAERLDVDNTFRLLAGGARTVAVRQQTLRAAIAWSYDLLGADEQGLFERLAVFAGDFTLDGAEIVGQDCGDVIDVLGQLVAKSMVETEPQADGSLRYRILEPLRQFGGERLLEHRELPAARRAHAAYVIGLAERAGPELHGPDQVRWSLRLAAELNNIRTADDWTAEVGDSGLAIRLGAALWWWWARPDLQAEGQRRLQAVLARSNSQDDPRARGRVVGALAVLTLLQGEMAAAEPLLELALTTGRAHADGWLESTALSGQAMVRLYRGNPVAAEPLLLEALAVARRAGVAWAAARSLDFLAAAALARGEPGIAMQRARESVRIARQTQDLLSQAMALTNLGDVFRAEKDYDQAETAYEEALGLFRALEPRGAATQGVAHNLGYVALARAAGHAAHGRGEAARAATLFLNSADRYRGVGSDWRGLAECVIGLGAVAVSMQEFELAARLFGAAEAALEMLGTGISPGYRADHERSLAALRANLTADTLASQWADGRQLLLSDALDQARGLATAPTAELIRDAPQSRFGLTPREHEVAMLLARGLGNRQIAQALVVTDKTAKNHVQRVLDKLGVRARAQVAARADEFGLGSVAAESST